MKGSIFFDLDGTLTDPSEGICAAVRYALTQMEIPVPQEAVLRSFIGPPLQNSFEHVLGLSPHRATQASMACLKIRFTMEFTRYSTHSKHKAGGLSLQPQSRNNLQ